MNDLELAACPSAMLSCYSKQLFTSFVGYLFSGNIKYPIRLRIYMLLMLCLHVYDGCLMYPEHLRIPKIQSGGSMWRIELDIQSI